MLPELKDIRGRRRALGISQNTLAEMAGINQGTVAKIEREKMVPNYRIARRIFTSLDSLERKDEAVVSEFMNRDVSSVSPDEPVEEAADRMSRKGFSNLPVVEEGRVIGRITERVLLEVKEFSLPCRDVMGPPLPSVPEKTPISIVKDILKNEPLVVVIGKGGRISGVVSRIDVL